MASLRNGGDRPVVRRGSSPAPPGTAPRVRPSSASSSRPSSGTISPDKDHPAAVKPTPNYLKPTISSKVPDAGTHPKVKSATAPTQRLNRIKSMEKPPAHQPLTNPHPHPHPHPTKSTSAAAAAKSSTAAIKASPPGSSSSSARAAVSSTRAITDKNRKPSPKLAAKSLALGTSKVRAATGPAAGKKKQAGASASSSPTSAAVAVRHQDVTEEGLETKDDVEPKTITVTTDPESPSAQEYHHGVAEHDFLEGEEEGEEEKAHPDEEDYHHPEPEGSHDPVPEAEDQSQPVSEPHDVTEHTEAAKHGEDNSNPLLEEHHPAEDHSTGSPLAPAPETNKFLSRSRTVPARPKPADSAKIPVDDELQRKLLSRKAWETGSGGADLASDKGNGEDATGSVSQRQDTTGKKESPAYNDVIEETASKLNEKRKNKVLALAGAFETVISLQEPKTPQSGQQSPATAPAAVSGAAETHTTPAAVVAEGDNAVPDPTVNGDEETDNGTAEEEEEPTESADVVIESNPEEVNKEDPDKGDAGAAAAKE